MMSRERPIAAAEREFFESHDLAVNMTTNVAQFVQTRVPVYIPFRIKPQEQPYE